MLFLQNPRTLKAFIFPPYRCKSQSFTRDVKAAKKVLPGAKENSQYHTNESEKGKTDGSVTDTR